MLTPAVCVAPMMDCTDRHYRYFARLMTKQVLLYTEMITTGAVLHGDRDYLLDFSEKEQPLALQLGGSDPDQLKAASKIAEAYGYQEINLNVGCPSDRVQAGRFGACLMKEPSLVAECVAAMSSAVRIPVTVKTRLGVDDQDSYDLLCRFIESVTAAGCTRFILHARKAWLKGLSPRENRDVPPLNYAWVYQLKRDYPSLEFIINGGIKNYEDIDTHLQYVDGVMIGREAYSNPYILAMMDQRYYGSLESPVSRADVVMGYLSYLQQELDKGVPLRLLSRNLIGIYKGRPNGRLWRRAISESNNVSELYRHLPFLR